MATQNNKSARPKARPQDDLLFYDFANYTGRSVRVIKSRRTPGRKRRAIKRLSG